MLLTRLICAIGVSLGAAVVAGSQTTPGTLSRELRAHVRDGRFDVITSIRGLPLGVREALQTLFDSQTLDIAEPGAEFEATGSSRNRNLPLRRMIVAGCSTDYHCLLYYERGGATPTHHVVLYHWTPTATRFEWGGVAPAGLSTIDSVRKAIVSGAIKDAAPFW